MRPTTAKGTAAPARGGRCPLFLVMDQESCMGARLSEAPAGSSLGGSGLNSLAFVAFATAENGPGHRARLTGGDWAVGASAGLRPLAVGWAESAPTGLRPLAAGGRAHPSGGGLHGPACIARYMRIRA